MSKKIPTDRDLDAEKLTLVTINSCTAYYDRSGLIRIIGELISQFGDPIHDYREVQVVVYDADGDIVFRDYTNWSEFGLRQSFMIEGESEDPSSDPVKVLVFPSG